MQANLNNNEKLKIIFSKLQNLEKSKEIKIWEIGTCFILHLKRWETLIKKINKEFSYEEIENLEILWTKINEKNDGIIELKSFKKIISTNFMHSKEYFFDNDKVESWANSTMRQFFEVGTSLGYISVDNFFKINNSFTLLKSSTTNIDDENILKQTIKMIKYSWNTKRLKGHSIRDIAITMIFTYYVLNPNLNNLKDVMDLSKIKFRTNNTPKGIEEININFSKKNSSLKKQTQINNWSKNKEFEMDFNSLLSFVYKKMINDWEIENISSENKALEFYINEGNRIGQKTYRDLMLNDYKRYVDEDKLNRHDLIDGIRNSRLVEAAHILDHRYCNDEEKYDSENGLLIDPTMHKYLDKDIITFNDEGYLFVKNDFVDEVKKVILYSGRNYQIFERVLTPKTISYIKRRNEIHSINFDNYQKV